MQTVRQFRHLYQKFQIFCTVLTIVKENSLNCLNPLTYGRTGRILKNMPPMLLKQVRFASYKLHELGYGDK